MTPKKRVKAADRTLDVLEAFSRTKRPLSLSELAKEIQMPVSSCHVLVKTLTSRGYINTFGPHRQHYPSKLLFDLASTLLENNPVLAVVSPYLQSLCDACGETVVLGKRLDNHVLYLDVLETTKTIRFSARISTLRDLHSSALGKALLAQLKEEERRDLVFRLSLAPITGHTFTDPGKLLANIDAGLERGWQLTDGESVDDVMAVAQGISLGGENHAIAIAGPLSRMQPRVQEHADALLSVIEKISQEVN